MPGFAGCTLFSPDLIASMAALAGLNGRMLPESDRRQFVSLV